MFFCRNTVVLRNSIRLIGSLLVAVTCSSSPLLAQRAPIHAALQEARIALPSHIPAKVAQSCLLGRLEAGSTLSLSITLPLRNPAELEQLLQDLYDPASPKYRHYLTPDVFAERFGPTPEDYDKVASFVRSQGFTITSTASNRALLGFKGSAAAIEKAFGLHLMRYQGADQRTFYAPDANPQVPATIASRIGGIVGLDNAVVPQHGRMSSLPAKSPALPGFLGGPPLSLFSQGATMPQSHSASVPPRGGTNGNSGVYGYLSPQDIRTAYSLNGIGLYGTGEVLNGRGQTLGVFEAASGYNLNDIATYVGAYGLALPGRSAPYYGLDSVLVNVLIDGFSGQPDTGNTGNDLLEVTADIELQLALAPGASHLYVYETPNTTQGFIDAYNRIATDNLATSVSSSWNFGAELSAPATLRNAENTAFHQMAAQGQSMFVASGDYGAYQTGSSLSVQDPASQPWVTACGGTLLSTNQTTNVWTNETTWHDTYGGSGGGVSAIWSIPGYQQYVGSTQSLASTTHRNVPDVALNSSGQNAYSIYVNGIWEGFYGTSAAAPLWAAYTAEVNQYRAANGQISLGFANSPIYNLGAYSRTDYYNLLFHDIADNSTNGYYPAVQGYDLATGWGSFIGNSLMWDLTQSPYTYVATPHFVSGGFPWLLFQNPANGNLFTWQTNPGIASTPVFINQEDALQQVNDPNWQVVGTPDLNGDGKSDILFRYKTTGNLYAWIMNGITIQSQGALNPVNDTNWEVVGTPDLNGDGKSDILFRYKTTGNLYAWIMNGVTVTAQGDITTPINDTNWIVVGTPDLNHDGISDIVLQNTSTGAVVYWLMYGGVVTASGTIGANTDSNWQVVGTPDLNGDGNADLLFQYKTNGNLYYWILAGTTLAAQGDLPYPNENIYRKVVATPDLNGDGKSDILFMYPNGKLYYWLMNGATVTAKSTYP